MLNTFIPFENKKIELSCWNLKFVPSKLADAT